MDPNILIQNQRLQSNEPDLSPYKAMIEGLAPLVNKANFNAEYERQTKSISRDLRFLVKMEIKRLAKPCIRSIDLRAIVKDECRLYQYHGIDHYLNVNGILSFEKLYKRYGEYTFGVYEGVMEEANKEKERYLNRQNNPEKRIELSLPEQNHIIPCQELLNYPTRKQERLNYVTAVELFFEDKSSVHASSLDISVNGLRIKLKNPDMLHRIKAFEPIQVVFRGVDKQYGLSRESIEYQVLNISGASGKANIHLYRDGLKNEAFDMFVNDLIRLNKHRYKVNLDNVEMALASKIYEQSFANNTPTLPVFVSRNKQESYHARYASMNANNKAILDYWLDENANQMIGFMLNQSRIQTLLNDNTDYPQMTIYCFNHVKDEKIYFYSATQEELANEPELESTFLAYAARKVSWRVFQVTCTDISPKDAYSPCSIPDGINKKIDSLNRALSPRLRANLDSIFGMISITDITCQSGQKVYQNRQLHRDRIRLLKAFGHARNKPPRAVEAFRHKQQELRRQTRYILRTPIRLKTPSQNIRGVTEDVSISGLKIELDEAFTQRLYSKVEISFNRLQDITDNFELQNLHYRVVHINADKQAIHLQAVAEEETSVAERFFSQLITNNVDRLKTVLQEEPVTGLSMSLRNLNSKYSPQFCAYIEKKSQGYTPAMATVSQVRAKWMEFLHHDKSLALVNLSWLYQDIREDNAFINQSLKMLKIDPQAIVSEIYVATPPLNIGDKQSNSGIARAMWSNQFKNQRERQRFIKQAQTNGDFLAFSVTLNKALKPDVEKIEQELLYLSQHAVHKATYFEERMWDIAGAIFLTDITPEVLYRYRVNN
jgi:hypothetical protein